MVGVPNALRGLVASLEACFNRPQTARRVVWMMAAAVLVAGNRTVSQLLRLIALVTPVNPSTWSRVFSQRRWSSMSLVRVLARFVLDRFVPKGVVRLCGDETVDGHRGKKVYGKARHRDAVRSSHSYTAFRYGHKWIVLAILVQLPYCGRPLALPLLVALYRDQATNRKEGRRHKTPVRLMCGLLALLLRWFPERKWVFGGDGGYGTHEFARFAGRHRRRLTLVSKFPPDASLFRPARARRSGQKGRPRVKGAALPKPQEVVARRRPRRSRVAWYGGGQRRVATVSDQGGWYKSGRGVVAVRWVFVRDLDGTHRDEYFFTTDPRMTPRQVIAIYAARWNIETTFQEMRSGLGLETTRGWSRPTVLRMAPCLFLNYTLVVIWHDALRRSGAAPVPKVRWQGKRHLAFSDMLCRVREHLWTHWIFAQAAEGAAVAKLPRACHALLLFGLTQAA